jgi:hypothetical protein
LGATRRRKIEEGIRTTEAHVPEITDWVLWTRRALIKADQEWFAGLSSTMTLYLWTADELDNLMVGQASVYRGTYFGELVLTSELLREQHEQSVAPIRQRWQPEVHQDVGAERELRCMLGETDSWHALRTLATDIRLEVLAAEAAPPVPALLASDLKETLDAARLSADALERVASGISDGDINLLRDVLTSQPRDLPPSVAAAPRRLRSGNHRAGLNITNVVAGCREALRLLAGVEAAFSSRIVAVVAPAGYGKTQLAAQLTSATNARPNGVLLHGRDLHANHTLDNLAGRVAIATQPVQGMERLLAAVDAAGQRARHRLPVVIDGLNESEDPRMWKPLLAALEATLTKYPYVLLVCTLRQEFINQVLPDGTRSVEITGYGEDAFEAIQKHFHHWMIDATDVSLPGFLEHPLTLRLFCEVTNPTRQKVVGIHAMPGSLTALFYRYLDRVAERIAELAPRVHRYCAQDVRTALTNLGQRFWTARSRSIDVVELSSFLGDELRPWDQRLVRALEHEGVLLRMPSDAEGVYVPVYDRLGGHIIASALLAKHGQTSFETWVRDPSTNALLAGDYNERHPFANDVLYSFVSQIPKRYQTKQLWQFVDEPLRSDALRTAAGLEASYLDAATVDALLDLVREGDPGLLNQLRQLRGKLNHPLNAEALDEVLRPMGVAERDLRWTEWVRMNQEEVLRDLEHLTRRWRNRIARQGDVHRARWVMWTLTSTVRQLRDQATLSLYWFGRVDPGGLFDLTIDSLLLNDAYISERMLAASYGVAISHQEAGAEFEGPLQHFLAGVANAMIGASATASTTHYLSRLYVRGIIEFATKFYPGTLPSQLSSGWSFAAPPQVNSIPEIDPRADEIEHTLGMDFKNYTLGRLFDDRSNYDDTHAGHIAAVAHVLGVVWDLGWRAEKFDALDSEISGVEYRGRGHRPFAERYGKKYCWIGFYTYAGVLEVTVSSSPKSHSFTGIDIDPSFPDKPPVEGEGTIPATWLSPSVESHQEWLCEGSTPIPHELVVRNKIGEHDGPWLLVHAFAKAEDRVLGRQAWAFISAMVTPNEGAQQLVAALQCGSRPRLTRDIPTDHYTYAGEIPWHPCFAAEGLRELGTEYAYLERIPLDNGTVEIEILAHEYAWESHHSEMNQAGNACVPSRHFSSRFDLRSVPQGFDQCLPDGTRATITLSGVDGLDGYVLYIREDLLYEYVSGRKVVWFAFGERELRPYPPSPPRWLLDAQRAQANAWCEVLTESELMGNAERRERS